MIIMDATLRKMDLAFCGSGQHKISPEKFLDTEGAVFLDVRSREETETLRFDLRLFNIEVICLPTEELPDRYHELPRERLIGTFCSSGTRSAWAYIYLLSKGYNVRWIEGGNSELAALLKPGKIWKKTSP